MVNQMDRWVGKVAVVTGASTGIGAAIAEELVKAGVKVVGLARRKELVKALADKLSGKRGQLYPVKADLTNERDIINAFSWIKKNLGPVHILVNNAGVTGATTLTDGDTKIWKRTIDINVMALCIATREAIKDMRANNVDGHIIHLNAILGHYTPSFPLFNIYGASKYAVTALTESLRHELNSLNSKIRITSISPGKVHTDFAVTAGFASSPEFKKFAETAPALEPQDLADTVIFVLGTPPHVQVHEVLMHAVGEKV